MQKNNPKILIIGTGSLLNYGCEAIVQGTYNILKKYLPDCKIYLASDDFEYDSKLLPNDIILVKYKKRFTLYRIFKGFLRRVFHIGKGSYVHMDFNIGKNFDIVLSSGGDNYCETPNKTIYPLLMDLMEIGKRTNQKGGKYILWGASVGPFKDKVNEHKVVSNLNLANQIFVRENLSYDYLSQFESIANKLLLVADPAFAMEPLDFNLNKKDKFKYIGINLSLLALGHSNCNNETFINSIITQFDKLLNKNKKTYLVFIPHVQQDGPQDDMNLLIPIYSGIQNKDRIILIDKGLGARKTKGLIKELDLLVASRMHCCVGGISVGTPTLFVTYSNKGKGMSYYAYKHHDYEIETQDLNSSGFISKIEYMLENRDELHEYLLEQKQRFLDDAYCSGQILAEK